MNRLIAAAGAAAALMVAACGSSGSAAGNASSSATGAAGSGQGAARLGRNGAAGELVRINGTTLVLNTTNGDVTVKLAGSTTLTQTHTGTVADIVPGSCIVAAGKKDATGAVTAATVRISPAVNGSCTMRGGPGGLGGGFGAGATPNPSRTPNPNRTPNANFAGVRGLVTSVLGTTVMVQGPTGAPVSVTVPTTVSVSTSATVSIGDLVIGQCVLATGSKDSTGTVSARALSIVPAGPSGCFTGGGRGFGGFGGGGFGAQPSPVA
jgi:hypothetical protein